MPPRMSLALAIHNHQPVGNFGWVFADVYEAAYLPMLEAVERHPGVHLSLHYTGALLEWLRAERPAFVARLRALIERGQVELLGGGQYEPVLASLPERDRVGQLTRMADELELMTGTRPRGAWLAERVWEPDVPTSLAAAGYRWTILDDAHFRAAAIPEDALWGAYTTEDQGRLLTVFGTEQGLRYRIPFGEVEDVVAYLRDHASEEVPRLGVMGDDGEKFGAWPTTWEHCWGRGRWVERFFTALEDNAAWLTTVTPSAWLDREQPIGRIYVPTGSYAEMGEWALPPAEGRVFTDVLHRAVEERRPEARWLRGGFWRNFQVRYREINDLHKQMLRASERVDAMPPGPAREAALDHLYRGQSNDCYWHGLFGGIYISHMRLATHEHLIAAEDIAAVAARTRGERVDGGRLADLDLDGIDEAILAAPGQVVTVKLAEGAGIGDWDIRAARHALTAVMRRRPEAYHHTLLEHERALAGKATGGIEGAADAGDGARDGGSIEGAASPKDGGSSEGGGSSEAASIHERVTTKEAGLGARLVYDWHERRSGLVHVFDGGTDPEELASSPSLERGDFVDRPFEVLELSDDRIVTARDGVVRDRSGALLPLRVTKDLRLSGGRLDPGLTLTVSVENRGAQRIEAQLGVAWDLTMLGGGGNPAAWHEVAGARSAHDSAGRATSVERVAAGNDHVGLVVETALEPRANVRWWPIETVSNSESGFERIYQGSSTMFIWPLALRPGGRTDVRMTARVAVARDRTAEEAAARADRR